MSEQGLSGYPSIDRPWMKYYDHDMTDAPRPVCSIYEYMYGVNKDYPNDIAIWYVNRKITYGELFANIDRCASAFLAQGVRPGEIVTVAMPSFPEALYCVYALNKIGAVANMIHPLAGEDEIVNYLNEVKSRVCVMFDGTYEIIKASIGKTSVKKAVVVSAADSLAFPLSFLYGLKNKRPVLPKESVFMDWTAFIAGGQGREPKKIKRNLDSVAIISHTGGTTGEPKGVMCSDNAVNSVLWQTVCRIPHGRQGRFMSVLPPFINYSLVTSMLQPLSIGFTAVLIPKYEPLHFDKYVRKYRPNYVISIPAYWEPICDDPKLRARLEAMDLSCLKLCIYGGEAMNTEKEIEINHLLLTHGADAKLTKGIGSTECTSVVTLTYKECNELNSVGIPLHDMLCKVIDTETGKELPVNSVGEVCFSGPTVMLGYYDRPDATAQVLKIHEDGRKWLHTGDLGRINEDGVLFITGRIKRIIMTKGNDRQVTKLFPDRIEKVIEMHPAVSMCCVIGVPDPVRINYASVYVELHNGFSPSDELKEDIRAFCKGKLPEYQIPDNVEFIDILPRTPREKVDYRALEEMMKEKSKES